MTTHQKAIIINHWWAGLLATLMVACVGGGVSVAKDVYDGQADAKQGQAVINAKLDPLVDSRLPERMAGMEQQLDSVGSKVEAIDRKVDVLIEQKLREQTK
jgi:hypothetical protein